MRRPLLFALSAVLAGALASAGAGAAVADTTPAPTPTPTVAPVTYLVDCSAKSDGDGVTTPWNSLADVNHHGDFQPGDQILLKKGTTCAGRLAPTGSGTAGAVITLGAYGSGAKPLVAGGGTASWTGAVQLTNQQYWTIQDLRVTNHTSKDTMGYRSGVLLLNSAGRLAGLTVQRLVVKDVESNLGYAAAGSVPRAFGGITAITGSVDGVGFDGLRILNSTVSGVARTGIIDTNLQYPLGRGYDLGTRISGNRVSNTRGDGIVLMGSRKGRIDHDVVSSTGHIFPCKHCGSKGPGTANAAIWTAFSNGVHIDHDEAYGADAAGGDGEGFDIDVFTENAVVEDDYSHDNSGGGVLVCAAKTATIRFNVIQNNGRAQIVFTCAQPAKNVSFLNNDIYVKSASTAAYLVRTGRGKGAKGISFRNNLVWTQGESIWQWPGRISASNNTVVGFHSATEPAGSSWSSPAIRHPGGGRNGMSSLSAYRWRNAKHPQRGSSVSKGLADLLGFAVNAKHPARGAISG